MSIKDTLQLIDSIVRLSFTIIQCFVMVVTSFFCLTFIIVFIFHPSS